MREDRAFFPLDIGITLRASSFSDLVQYSIYNIERIIKRHENDKKERSGSYAWVYEDFLISHERVLPNFAICSNPIC